MNDVEMNRLRWRCRRGLLENDLVLERFLKKHGYRPRQVQDFIPAPMDIATCIYHTGIDPLTMAPVDTVKKLRDRQTQRALMQFFEPRNWFVVHKALVDAGRRDLIGGAASLGHRGQPTAWRCWS